MKYRISTNYQQPVGPPVWEYQDNIVLMPKDIASLTRDLPAAPPRKVVCAENGQAADRKSGG